MSVSEAMQQALLECKSSEIYSRWMRRYDKFKETHGYFEDTIGIFMDFIRDLSSSYAVSSLWQAASCVNKNLQVTKNVEFITTKVFKSYMKKLGKNYVPKKCPTLGIEEINRYLRESEKTSVNLQVNFFT